MNGPHWNRRDFLRFAGLAVTAAGTVGFAGCGAEGNSAAVGVPDARATPERDRAVINGALTLENTAVAAYAMGLPLLRGDARRYAERFLDQEREHAAALAALVRDMGGEPNRPKPAAEYRAAFPRLPDQAAFLRFATDLESVTITAYADGIPKLAQRPAAPDRRRRSSATRPSTRPSCAASEAAATPPRWCPSRS